MAENSEKISEKVRFAGDVDINDVTIITAIGFAQTVTPQVVGIEIYEDMFSMFISGKLILQDSQEISNLMPLVGEEVIRLKVSTPSLPAKDVYEKEFYIYKMDDRMKTQEREVVYVLHFISKEAIIDLNKKISKAYSGKVSKIVEELITSEFGLESKKTFNIEDTSNKTKFVSNFWSPTRCLQYCADNAVSVTESPSYVFFENKYGFNFISIETLYAGAPLMQRFIWDNYSAEIGGGSSERDIEKDYQRVIEFQMSDVFNYIDRLQSGFYGSEIIYYDILTKQYVHTYHQPEFEKQNHLNEHPLYSSKVAARPKGLLMHDHMYYNNFEGYSDTTNTQTIQKRKALLSAAEAYKVTITVFGRTDYSAGQKIYLEVPKNTQIKEFHTKDDIEDKLLSGYYLIGSICHFISREKHECTMELIKDSIKVNLNDPE
jgi:hypothetical protein